MFIIPTDWLNGLIRGEEAGISANWRDIQKFQQASQNNIDLAQSIMTFAPRVNSAFQQEAKNQLSLAQNTLAYQQQLAQQPGALASYRAQSRILEDRSPELANALFENQLYRANYRLDGTVAGAGGGVSQETFNILYPDQNPATNTRTGSNATTNTNIVNAGMNTGGSDSTTVATPASGAESTLLITPPGQAANPSPRAIDQQTNAPVAVTPNVPTTATDGMFDNAPDLGKMYDVFDLGQYGINNAFDGLQPGQFKLTYVDSTAINYLNANSDVIPYVYAYVDSNGQRWVVYTDGNNFSEKVRVNG